MTYADYVAGAGPLSGTITKSASYRVPVVNAPYGVDPIVFSDRVLILSDVGASGMRPTVIFR